MLCQSSPDCRRCNFGKLIRRGYKVDQRLNFGTTYIRIKYSKGVNKPTFYSVAKSLTADAKAKSAYAQWYKWSKFEHQKREKGKVLWYMGSPITTTDPFSQTTTTLTTTTAKIGGEPTESSDPSNISAIPSYLLRSTAVYSPPHGDRVPSGRSELTNTDTSVFKYYMPENRSKPTVRNCSFLFL